MDNYEVNLCVKCKTCKSVCDRDFHFLTEGHMKRFLAMEKLKGIKLNNKQVYDYYCLEHPHLVNKIK